MSNITLFKNGADIPAFLRKNELDDVTKSLMGSGGGNNKSISIRGSVFRMMVNGKEVQKNEDRSMNVIIVNAAPKVGRNYYSKGYAEGVNTNPDCWSNDGEKPDPRSENRQSSACATCPMNIAGSGQGSSKACSYRRRLAVMLENDPNEDIYSLALPSQSLFGKGENGKMPLLQYSDLLASHGINVTSVVTELRFDTSSATPKLVFRASRPLTEAEWAISEEKRNAPETLTAISFVPPVGEKKDVQEDAPAPKKIAAKPIVEEEDEPAPAPKARPKVEESFEEIEEPKVRETKKAAPVVEEKADKLKSVLDAWDDEDDEDDE